MLDDVDVFYNREATEILDGKPAPKWFSFVFLAFNLLAARGVYFNLLHLSVKDVVLSFVLWLVTFGILVFHNSFFKRLDKALNS